MAQQKEWRTVKIPDGLISQVEKYLASKDAAKRGFTSISGFIVYSVRKEIESRNT